MDEEGQKGKVAWCCERDTESTSKQFCIGSTGSHGVFYDVALTCLGLRSRAACFVCAEVYSVYCQGDQQVRIACEYERNSKFVGRISGEEGADFA